VTSTVGYVQSVILAALVLIIGLVATAAWLWYAAHLHLAGTSMTQRRRLMRWTTAASVGTGVAILVIGLVASALTGYWLILVPIWSFGLLHINFAVQAWLRWTRKVKASAFPEQSLLRRLLTPGCDSFPSSLIGANGFAGQDHCSRVCGAKHRRAAGAPLTVILSGKRIIGTVGRATRTDRLSAVPETA